MGEPALDFLHFWGGAARTWHQLTRTLEHSYRCIAYDQRGWGTADAPETGYELDDLAGDLSTGVARLRASRYVLIGPCTFSQLGPLSQQPILRNSLKIQ